MTKKMNKYKNYVTLCKKLTLAKEQKFIYECLFIERLIIEDRLSSILKHLNVPNSKYANVSLKGKMKIILEQTDPKIHVLFNKQLIIDLKNWDFLFGQYLKTINNKTYDERKLITVQKEGDRIRKKLDSISKKFVK